MSEEFDFEALEAELDSGPLENPNICTSLALGISYIVVDPHECEDEEHGKGSVNPCLVLMFTDIQGNNVPIIIPPETGLLDALCDMDIYYSIKNIAENELT